MKKIALSILFMALTSAYADATTTTTTTNNATTDATTTATTINCKDENNYPIVSKADVQALLQDKTTVVFDVNGKDSYKKAHIPGAIDFVTHEKSFAKYLPQDKKAPIIAYCGGPMCSAWKKAAEKACNMGYTNIKHYKDGIAGWTKS